MAGAAFGPAHQITFTDHSNHPVILIDNGQTADTPFQHHHGYLLDGPVRFGRDDINSHDVCCVHDTLH